jgi:hypothetical protein
MVERGGNLIARKVDNVQAPTLTVEIVKHIKETASIFTDEWL